MFVVVFKPTGLPIYGFKSSEEAEKYVELELEHKLCETTTRDDYIVEWVDLYED